MDIRKLQRLVVDALEDIKAQDIQVFNTTAQTALFDRVVIATASSNRQTRALASHVAEKAKAAGGEVIATEGEDTGEWVLVDLADIVVHIMQPAIRSYYNLEEIWGAKPVKLADAKAASGRKAAATSTDTPDSPADAPASADPSAAASPATKQPAKKPAAKKPAAKKPAAKKPGAKKPAAKPSATKKPATKASASKKPASAQPAAKKPATRKLAAVKPATRRAAGDKA